MIIRVIHFPAEMGAIGVVKIVLKVEFFCVKCKVLVMKAIAAVMGIDKIEIDAEKSTVTVTGEVDPVAIVKQVRKAGMLVEIVTVGPPPKAEPSKPPAAEPSKPPAAEPAKPPDCCKKRCKLPDCCKEECKLPDCCKEECKLPVCCKEPCKVPVCCEEPCDLPFWCKKPCREPCKKPCKLPIWCGSWEDTSIKGNEQGCPIM